LDYRAGAFPDLDRALLNPAGLRKDLLLVPSNFVSAVVKQHEPGTGGSLVDGTDEIGHHYSSGFRIS
jgi:hypothetical protein